MQLLGLFKTEIFKINFFQQRITFQPVKIIATKSCCVASNLVTDCKLISKTYYFLCKKLQVHLWNITNLLVMTKFLQANIFSENSCLPSNLLKTICKKVPKWQDWFVITCSVQRFFIQCVSKPSCADLSSSHTYTAHTPTPIFPAVPKTKASAVDT